MIGVHVYLSIDAKDHSEDNFTRNNQVDVVIGMLMGFLIYWNELILLKRKCLFRIVYLIFKRIYG